MCAQKKKKKVNLSQQQTLDDDCGSATAVTTAGVAALAAGQQPTGNGDIGAGHHAPLLQVSYFDLHVSIKSNLFISFSFCVANSTKFKRKYWIIGYR